MVQTLWKTVGQFLTKLTTVLPYSLATALLGNYPNELKIYVKQNPEQNVYCSLFTTDHIWKQPRCLSTGEQINTLR